MSEAYRNSTQFVYLDITGGVADAAPTAACLTPGHNHTHELEVTGPETVGDVQRWTAILGLVHTQEVGEVKVVWDFSMGGTPAQKINWIDVVVPLVELDDIQNELDLPPDLAEDDLTRAERQVRRIIENFTGQVFAPTNETLIVKGRGDSVMRMPKRLISISGVTNFRTQLALTGYEIRDDGWNLLRTLSYYYGDELHVNGPIYDPFRIGNYRWPHNVEWQIAGRWGWERVPANVQEAALILIEQRLCPETKYRDSYLTSMKAADWRFDYSPSAHAGTGNVVADQLLRPYAVVNMAVI